MKKQNIIVGSIMTIGVLVAAPVAYAATTANSQLTQGITAGALSTSVVDASSNVVASPSFGMSSVTSSTNATQNSTGTFGTNAQRIAVDNPGSANDGWTLALSAAGAWTDGAKTYPFNAATAGAGQLSVDPATSTITPVTGTATGVTKGTAGTFSGSTTSVTLLNAGSTSDDVWNGYLTGVGLNQTIPAATPVGNYSLTVTQTVTAQ